MSFKPFVFLNLLLIFLPGFLLAKNDPSIDKFSHVSKSGTRYDITTGERIFYGLIPTGANTINCASCHNVDQIDTLNWNPSAMDIALKCSGMDTAAFRSLLLSPTGKLMTATHDSLKLSAQQIFQIQVFLADYAKNGGIHVKPPKINNVIFIILVLLFCLTVIDLTLTKKIRFKFISVIVLIISIVCITAFIVKESINLGRSQGYMPDQPIKFSHKVHAGQNQTECLYCHYNATQSKFAGIPPANVCMNCHIIVAEGSRSGKFEIDKIYKSIQNNKPIEWIKVDNLPDHVFFSHSQHVVAGNVDCSKCHGDVKGMDQIIQLKDFSMGFCVNCHRETGVQFNNKFYRKYGKLDKDFKEGKIKMVTVDKTGGTDCMKCHY